MKNIGRLIWSIFEIIIIVYVITITAFILCRNKYGYTQFGDYTLNNVSLIDERNISTAKKGDLLVVKNSNDFKEGDLIYYYAAYNDTYIVRSDNLLKIDDDGYTSLYTIKRGEDEITVVDTRIIGKYSHTYKGLGAFLDVVESRVGFLFLVLLPIMIVFIYQVYEFVMIIRYEKVDDDINKDEDDSSKEKVEEKKERPAIQEDEII